MLAQKQQTPEETSPLADVDKVAYCLQTLGAKLRDTKFTYSLITELAEKDKRTDDPYIKSISQQLEEIKQLMVLVEEAEEANQRTGLRVYQ